MKSVGILQAFNEHRDGLGPEFPTDSDRLRALAKPVSSDLKFHVYDLTFGERPRQVDDHWGYIISGSPASVNESLPYLPWLSDFIIECDRGRRKLMGVCFGHQIIVKALGGVVGPSPKHWNVGVRQTIVHKHKSYMRPEETLVACALHNEEVHSTSAGFEQLGSARDCKYALLAKGRHIFTTQLHPEMSREFLDDVLENDASLAGVKPTDDICEITPELFASWLGHFFCQI